MDVLRAAHGRLDTVDYGCVKAAFLDAHRLRIGASALRATPAETHGCAEALLAAVPQLHAAATPAARELARRAVASVLSDAAAVAASPLGASDARVASRTAELWSGASAAAETALAAAQAEEARRARAEADAASRAAAGAASLQAAMRAVQPSATPSPQPQAPPQAPPRRSEPSVTADDDDFGSDDEFDPYGGEEKPDAAAVLAATRAAFAAAAKPDAATSEFRAASAARRAEYSSAGHTAAGPAVGRRFVKSEL